jgi:hypothetical protein
VVLAEGVELDVAHEDHVLVRLLEYRLADHLPRIHPVAARQPGQCLRHPLRRLDEAIALGVLIEELEHPPHEPLELPLPRLAVRRSGLAVLDVECERG